MSINCSQITEIIFANFWLEKLEDELVKKFCELVSDLLIKLALDSLDTQDFAYF
jgi:hypothetical protein